MLCEEPGNERIGAGRYNEAICLDPSLAVAYISKGFVLSELRRYTEVLASFDRTICLDSTFLKAYENKSTVRGNSR